MSGINDGGSAFPVWELNGDSQPELMYHGISMRDYFAAKVMPKCIGLCSTTLLDAEEAYKIADAMIEARQS